MKTKFYNCPPGIEGKNQRAVLRQYGRGYLLAWCERLKQSNFSALPIDLKYIPEREGDPGYLSCILNDNELVRFYFYPNDLPVKSAKMVRSRLANRIEYRYTADDQTVSFEVTKDGGFQNLFSWLEWSGKVWAAIDSAKSEEPPMMGRCF